MKNLFYLNLIKKKQNNRNINSYLLLIDASKALYKRLNPFLEGRKSFEQNSLSNAEYKALVGIRKLAELVVKPEFAKIDGKNTSKLVASLAKKQDMPIAWFRKTDNEAAKENIQARIRILSARVLLAYERVKKWYGNKLNAFSIDNVREEKKKVLEENGLQEVFAAVYNKKNGRRQSAGAHWWGSIYFA